MKFNASKTQVMKLNTEKKTTREFTLNDQPIPECTSCKYLGDILNY